MSLSGQEFYFISSYKTINLIPKEQSFSLLGKSWDPLALGDPGSPSGKVFKAPAMYLQPNFPTFISHYPLYTYTTQPRRAQFSFLKSICYTSCFLTAKGRMPTQTS